MQRHIITDYITKWWDQIAPTAQVAIFFRTEFRATPAVTCDINQMAHVFTAIFHNAIHALEDKTLSMGKDFQGDIVVRSLIKDKMLVIYVLDTGTGITMDIIDKIFLPGFSSKAPTRRTGYGLASAQQIVTDMGGDITVDTIPGKGAEFIVTLPLN